METCKNSIYIEVGRRKISHWDAYLDILKSRLEGKRFPVIIRPFVGQERLTFPSYWMRLGLAVETDRPGCRRARLCLPPSRGKSGHYDDVYDDMIDEENELEDGLRIGAIDTVSNSKQEIIVRLRMMSCTGLRQANSRSLSSGQLECNAELDEIFMKE